MDATAGNVVWGLECSWSNIIATFGNTTLTTITDAADGVADKHQIVYFDEFDGSGKTFSSMLMCRCYRDAGNAADTYASDAALLEIDFHFIVNRFGTSF